MRLRTRCARLAGGRVCGGLFGGLVGGGWGQDVAGVGEMVADRGGRRPGVDGHRGQYVRSSIRAFLGRVCAVAREYRGELGQREAACGENANLINVCGPEKRGGCAQNIAPGRV